MKGHVTTALRWSDVLAALWLSLRWGHRSLDQFREAFAGSLALDAHQLSVFGSGRAALHALLRGLDLPADAEVLLPGYTCVVVPNVFLHLGLRVRYVDITATGFNPDPAVLSSAIRPQTAMVVVPHNFGLCMAGIEALREQHPDVVFVEDAAHAWGSRDAQGRMAGTRAQAAFFSFEYSKPLTTGIGGALVLNDEHLARRLAGRLPALRAPSRQALIRQGLTLLWHRLSQSLPGPVFGALQAGLRWPARYLGAVASTPATELTGDSQPDYGLGLHPWSASLGWRQVRRAQQVWSARQRQARVYDELLSGAPGWAIPARTQGEVLLRYPVRIADPGQRARVMQGLQALDIVPGVWFDDVVHPAGSVRHGYRDGDCPNGQAAALAVLNLPLGLHADLTARQRAGLRQLAWGPAAP